MSLILPFIRLQADEQQGLAPEPVTMKEFQRLQYDYCAWTLAEKWLAGGLAFIETSFPELDGEAIPVKALTLFNAAEDFADAGELMCHGRRDTMRNNPYGHDVEYGYVIPPTGPTDAFGAYAQQTRAWMNIHRIGPALVFRRTDKSMEPLLDKWLHYWAQSLEFRCQWPDKEAHGELIVHESMKRLTTVTGRTRRVRGSRAVARFLGL